MAIRLDQDQLDQIIAEVRRDADFVTQHDLTNALGALMSTLKSGKLHTPNRSGGANGPEIASKLNSQTPVLGTVGLNTNAPVSSTAGQVDLGQKDSSVGSTATLDLTLEEATIAIGTFTPSHKLAIYINGIEYHLQLDAV